MPTSVSAGRPKLIACVLKWFQAGLFRTAPANPCVPLLLCLNYLLALQHSQRTFAPVQYSINLIMDQNHMPCTLLNTDAPLYFFSNVIFVRPVPWNITVVPTCSPAVDKKLKCFLCLYQGRCCHHFHVLSYSGSEPALTNLEAKFLC